MKKWTYKCVTTNVPTYCWYGSGPVWAQAEGSQLGRARGHGGLSWSQGRHCKEIGCYDQQVNVTLEVLRKVKVTLRLRRARGHGGLSWSQGRHCKENFGMVKKKMKVKLDVMIKKWNWKWECKGLRRAHQHGDLSWSQGRHLKISWDIMMIKKWKWIWKLKWEWKGSRRVDLKVGNEKNYEILWWWKVKVTL